MEDNTNIIYKNIGRYSLWFAIAGVICCFTIFPDGIYYGFFCGVMAVASAMISKRYISGVRFTVGLILGFIDAIVALMAFYGMYLIYESIGDPIMGPKVTEFISNALSQNGMSMEAFTKMMGQ